MNLLWRLAASMAVVLIALTVLMATGGELESARGAVFTTCILFGSVFFFFGKYLTASGFSARGGYVNIPTPESVWKLAGVVVYIIAVLVFIFYQ